MSSRIVRWTEADGDVGAFARRLRTDHPGDLVDVRDVPLADALVAAGATAVRWSLLMALDPLPTSPVSDPRADRAGVEVVPMATDPDRYAGALLRAFPPDHPDFDPAISDLASSSAALHSCFTGSVIGPFLVDGSMEARLGGEVVGGIIVARMPADDGHPDRPWVTEVFVEPAHHGRGIGKALFTGAVAGLVGAGESSLWLAVQVDNPARHLYDRMGFEVDSAWGRFSL